MGISSGLWPRFSWILATSAASWVTAAESEFALVRDGQPRVLIHAPAESESAGRRLAERLKTLTGADVQVSTSAESPAEGGLVAIGTIQSNPLIAKVLTGDKRLATLGNEGLLLQCSELNGRRTLVAAGNTPGGVHNAVSELVSWKLHLSPKGASVPADLNVAQAPGLKYRIVWTSDGQANWSNTLEEMHTIQKGTTGTMVVPYTREGFLTHFQRNIDFLSDHKLNGCILWGFLRDEHGGLDTGRVLSRYAREHNVRMLPGVCTQAAYGGFIYSQKDRFSLVGWLKEHPELRGRAKDGSIQTEAICPSKAANQEWLREGTAWLFKNLPDIGGVNLENGDLMECFCDECLAAKKRPENDPNFLWDMMASQRPVVETAQRLRPDAWITFATYVGFAEATIRGLKGSPQYPPRFLSQYPANAICQWTFTSMTTPHSWPEGLRPPPASFKEHIGLLHHGSVWGAPVEPGRWWAAPGAMFDDCSTIMPFVCSRAKHSGSAGVAITGQTGAASPANELNFLAFEYFSWHPDRTYDDFISDHLTLCYGDLPRAQLFLKLLRNTTRTPAEIEKDRQQALVVAGSSELDVRQGVRWRNLADELLRRRKLAEDPETFKTKAP